MLYQKETIFLLLKKNHSESAMLTKNKNVRQIPTSALVKFLSRKKRWSNSYNHTCRSNSFFGVGQIPPSY